MTDVPKTAADLGHLIVRERPAEHVALLRINRPDKKNALHSSMVIALSRELDGLAEDPPSVRS